jgi:hypothetical protein
MITLENMHEHTAQEIFDLCAKHLLTQNEHSHSRHKACMYRSPNGLKCALGVLISDEEYSGDMESKGITTLLREFGSSNHIHHGLLHDFQSVHDNGHSVSCWPNELIGLAMHYNLSYKTVTNFK